VIKGQGRSLDTGGCGRRWGRGCAVIVWYWGWWSRMFTRQEPLICFRSVGIVKLTGVVCECFRCRRRTYCKEAKRPISLVNKELILSLAQHLSLPLFLAP
jgi:hypothetical protein